MVIIHHERDRTRVKDYEGTSVNAPNGEMAFPRSACYPLCLLAAVRLARPSTLTSASRRFSSRKGLLIMRSIAPSGRLDACSSSAYAVIIITGCLGARDLIVA